jgi:hypothetical protein
VEKIGNKSRISSKVLRLTAIVRSALADEALSTDLKGRIAEMQERLDRLQDRASKRRQIAKDVMIELDIKKIDVGPGSQDDRIHRLAMTSTLFRET